jgi:hypothetical protein
MGVHDVVPLARGQRIAAAVIGTVLAGGGSVSVFVGDNQAGSVTLLLGGALFLLIAVSGMPILGAKLRDFELHLAVRRARQVRDVASRLPDEEAERLLQVLEDAKGSNYEEPLLVLIDSLLFEARVTNAVVCAVQDGERAEPHPEAGIGDPLIVHESTTRDLRIGVFAMFAPSEDGTLTSAFRDQFTARFSDAGCDAAILITCVRDRGDLAALASRVRELGSLVLVERWSLRDGGSSLRPAIDQLSAELRGLRANLPQQAQGSETECSEPTP